MTSRTFYRFRFQLLRLLPLRRHAVRPQMPLELIIPEAERRRVWLELRQAGFRLPPLRLPLHVTRRSKWRVLTETALIVLKLCMTFNLPGLVGLLAAIPLSILEARRTEPLATEIPPPFDTVRTTVLYLTPLRDPENPRSRPTREQISLKVRLIIAGWADLPLDKVQEKTRFMDLGLV